MGKIARMKRNFVYITPPLVSHRICIDSTTTKEIESKVCEKENYIMLCKFWPEWFVRRINHFYVKSKKSNRIKGQCLDINGL